jgi:hypothetical protein
VRDRKGFSTSFLMRRVAISAEALQLLASAPPAPFPRSWSSSARVKTGDNVFGECLQHDYSRRVAISVEALQLLASAPPAPFPLLAFGLPENPYIRPRLVILREIETTRCAQIFPSHGLRAQDLGRVGASEMFVGFGVRLLR